MSKETRNAWGPAAVTLIVLAGVAGVSLFTHGWDPLALVHQGTHFTQHDPYGSWGYDGQFYYAMAAFPDPREAAFYIDVPAYRYQRILYPLLARLMALGSPARIPWTLIATSLAAQAAGAWIVARLLAGWGASPWYALIYGLFPGFALSVYYDLPETLAFALAAGAVLAGERGRPWLSWVLYGLALFTKEVTLAFFAAAALSLLAARRWRALAGLGLVGGLPYALFQGWLWLTFGRLGFGSGGALATPFLPVPYLGLLGAFFNSPTLLSGLALFALFAATAVAPSLWGLWRGIGRLAGGDHHPLVWGLVINALAILPLPMSTFGDLRGMLRFEDGLLLSVLLFVAYHRCVAMRRTAGLNPLSTR